MNDSLLQPGATLEQDLHVRRHVASGGMGDVYEAWDDGLGRRVAVKVLRRSLHDDATTPTLRAIREGRATARVVHPAIVAIYRVGRVAGAPMLVMEWVDGPNLRAELARGTPPTATALRWLTEIADAVEVAHERGVLHCDLKPENVLLAPDGVGGQRVKVVDFGLARGDALPQHSAQLRHGTRAYLPPEAGDVAPGPALDLYALAVLACELLSGERPRSGLAGPRLPGGLPAGVARVLARALDLEPARRPRSAAAFAEAVAAAMQSPDHPAEASTTVAAGTTGAGGALEAGTSGGEPAVAALDVHNPSGGPPSGVVTAAAPIWADLPRATLRDVVQAAFAMHRQVDVGAIQDALAPAALDPVLAELQRQGWLVAVAGGLAPADASLAQLALDRLDQGLRSALHGSLAAVWGTLGTGDDRWGDEAIIAAWLAAGRPDAAARRVAASARRSASVRGRDRGLSRAATLLEQGGAPSLRLAILLERAALAVAAGWLDAARDVLVVARWLAAGLGLGADSWPALSMRAIDAALRLAVGDAEGAALRFASVARQAAAAQGATHAAQDALTALAVRAAAEAVSAALLAGTLTPAEASVRLDLQHQDLDRLEANEDALAALAAHETARAWVAAASERAFAATASLRRAVAWQLERGDRLAAATLLLLTAELGLQADARLAAEALDEADALLDGIGQVGASSTLALLRARQRQASGDMPGALRWAAVAMSRAEALDLAVQAVQAADTLAEIAVAMRDEAGAWQARKARSQWARKLRVGGPRR